MPQKGEMVFGQGVVKILYLVQHKHPAKCKKKGKDLQVRILKTCRGLISEFYRPEFLASQSEEQILPQRPVPNRVS